MSKLRLVKTAAKTYAIQKYRACKYVKGDGWTYQWRTISRFTTLKKAKIAWTKHKKYESNPDAHNEVVKVIEEFSNGEE